jgi:di- and tripeptidase
MPALSHLLSIEQGKVLSLAADEAHVYAGCQSEDNEITASPSLSVVDVS